MVKYDVFDTVREVVDFITDTARLGWDVPDVQAEQVKGFVRSTCRAMLASDNGMSQGYIIITSLGGVYTANSRMVADGIMSLLSNGITKHHMFRVTVYDENIFPYSVRDMTA